MTPSPELADDAIVTMPLGELRALEAENDRLRAALEDHLSGRIGHVRLRGALDPTEAPDNLPEFVEDLDYWGGRGTTP